MLSRFRLQENSDPPPLSRSAGKPMFPQRLQVPQDPFNVHPGEPLLLGSDFEAENESILYGSQPHHSKGRHYRPIRRRCSQCSRELSDMGSHCSTVPTHEQELRRVMDPYHQYAYSTRLGRSPSTPPVLHVTHDSTDGELEVDCGIGKSRLPMPTSFSPPSLTVMPQPLSPTSQVMLASFIELIDLAIGT